MDRAGLQMVTGKCHGMSLARVMKSSDPRFTLTD